MTENEPDLKVSDERARAWMIGTKTEIERAETDEELEHLVGGGDEEAVQELHLPELLLLRDLLSDRETLLVELRSCREMLRIAVEQLAALAVDASDREVAESRPAS